MGVKLLGKETTGKISRQASWRNTLANFIEAAVLCIQVRYE